MITGEQILADRSILKRLKGSYCHQLDNDGFIEYQGYISSTKGGLPVVRFFEWFTGYESGQESTISFLEIEKWRFYETKLEFEAAYEADNARLEAREIAEEKD